MYELYELERGEQLGRFRAAFPDATVTIEHTGGGCFWLAFRWENDPVYYVATDGEASLPARPEGDVGETVYSQVVSGGWGYVGRHNDTEDDKNPDYEGTVIREPEQLRDHDYQGYWETYPDGTLSDADVVEAIQNDRKERGV